MNWGAKFFPFAASFVHYRGWADLPAHSQGEIWPAKRQIILRKPRGRAEAACLILNADFADGVDAQKYP